MWSTRRTKSRDHSIGRSFDAARSASFLNRVAASGERLLLGFRTCLPSEGGARLKAVTFLGPLALAVMLIALGATHVAIAAQVPSTSSSLPPDFDGYQISSRYVESFDGTKLAVTVYMPTHDGEVGAGVKPVVVTQARDDQRPQVVKSIKYFTSHGYVWVAADRRGTGASFGVQTGFVNDYDAKDGKAIIEWAGQQPFSNGRVATYGCSNQGAWQYVVMKYRPKYLVAVSPQCASAQFYDNGISMSTLR